MASRSSLVTCLWARPEAYPRRAPFSSFILWKAHKQYTSVERTARDKHSSLLRTIMNYDLKCFITLGLGADVIRILQP